MRENVKQQHAQISFTFYFLLVFFVVFTPDRGDVAARQTLLASFFVDGLVGKIWAEPHLAALSFTVTQNE